MPPPTEQQHAANSLEWKSPLTLKDIVKYPDPRLREKNATIKVFGDRLQHLADELFDVMYKYGSYIPPFAMCAGHCRESVLVGPLDGHIRQYRPFLSTHQPTFIALCRDDGVGLAAPQVGLNLRLMVFNPAGERGKGEELILANPRIVSSTGLELDQEGCLSFKLPGGDMINGDVEVRPLLRQHTPAVLRHATATEALAIVTGSTAPAHTPGSSSSVSLHSPHAGVDVTR